MANAVRTFFALLVLVAIPCPASADFVAAEAAMKRGEYPSAYLACKSEADAGDAECQHLVGYFYQGLRRPLAPLRRGDHEARGSDYWP